LISSSLLEVNIAVEIIFHFPAPFTECSVSPLSLTFGNHRGGGYNYFVRLIMSLPVKRLTCRCFSLYVGQAAGLNGFGNLMTSKTAGIVQVDGEGRLVLPPEAAAYLGLKPGTQSFFSIEDGRMVIQRPASQLARVYVEPTNICNLDCATCMRNVWDEPLGRMSTETFTRIMDGLKQFSPLPTVFFGGYGEPLAHPGVVEMVRQAHEAGASVELITNGTLLLGDKTCQLVEAGLDRLWVSIDGATPESYEDVRLGDALPQVIENLTGLRDLRTRLGITRPSLGIAFVAMRRNITDLPAVLRLGEDLGADRFSISNVLAHTLELRGEVLYERSMYRNPAHSARPLVDLPRFDLTPETSAVMLQVLQAGYSTRLAGGPLVGRTNLCSFVEKGSLSVRWDGEVSPCLPLLHSHSSYLDNHMRKSQAHSFGNIGDRSLSELWFDPAYSSLRTRLQSFDFSPCVYCNTCEFSEHNQEDCFGNDVPTCGGCLWAQGLIQCP
jgi:MoaA/NifB/PqqE/SkfB family radical SAM enzyme